MKILLWVLVVAVALSSLHFTALWAERRGWIYYKHRKASPGSLGSAFLEVQSLLQPETRHAVESRNDTQAEEDASGDPPERPGNGTD